MKMQTIFSYFKVNKDEKELNSDALLIIVEAALCLAFLLLLNYNQRKKLKQRKGI